MIDKMYIEEYAEEHSDEYGRCETCTHYCNCSICSYCIEGSDYEFDYEYYYEENKEEIDEWYDEEYGF